MQKNRAYSGGKSAYIDLLRGSLRFFPVALSILYVVAVFTVPLVLNLGVCDQTNAKTLCKYLPAQKLTEFDKWGSYLSGALVPLSLLWVALAFRLQQQQLAEQAIQQTHSATLALEAQKINDRQTLVSMAPMYLARMDQSLLDLAELINSNLPAESPNHFFGQVPQSEFENSERAVGAVFIRLHNLTAGIARGEVNERDLLATKELFVDTDMSDFLNFFFEIYNEFYLRCRELECLVLLPPRIEAGASSLKYSILRTSWRWHPDEEERARLLRLVGWTDGELNQHFLDVPSDNLWEPYVHNY